jgi:putative membrane fusion protein
MVQKRKFKVIQGEGRGVSHSRTALYYLAVGLVAVLVLLVAYHWTGNFFLVRRLQIATPVLDYLEHSIEAAGVVTRQEQVLSAPDSGIIVAIAPPGERVPAGKELATILLLSREEATALLSGENLQTGLWERVEKFFRELRQGVGSGEDAAEPLIVTGEVPPWYNETVTLTSASAGLLSYHLDGWEQLWEEAYLPEETFLARPPAPLPVEGQFVERGEPLLKIVNNWSWKYHVVLPLDQGRTAAAHDSVTIFFKQAPEHPVPALLEKRAIDAAAGEVRLSYRIDQEIPGFEQMRWSASRILLRKQYGMIIPAAALTEKGGEKGVLVNRGGLVVFIPVTVIAQGDGKALVEGLAPDSLVIGRPGLVEEGQRLN